MIQQILSLTDIVKAFNMQMITDFLCYVTDHT